MEAENTENPEKRKELPDEWWYRVYVAVVISNILVIVALWTFSQHFSN